MYNSSTGSADIKYLTGSDQEEIQRSSALSLLKMKEQRRSSQVAIDDIVEGSRSLFCRTFDRLKAGINAQLAEVGVDPEFVGLEKVFEDIVHPYHGLETCHLQEKYFRESLDLIVSILHRAKNEISHTFAVNEICMKHSFHIS